MVRYSDFSHFFNMTLQPICLAYSVRKMFPLWCAIVFWITFSPFFPMIELFMLPLEYHSLSDSIFPSLKKKEKLFKAYEQASNSQPSDQPKVGPVLSVALVWFYLPDY